MKNTKKIALAAMSLVAAGVAAAGATGTFAWFAVNNTVNVTGMTFSTKVSSNLLIAGTNAEANYISALNQAREARLEPVSSINGLDGSFFYTAKGAADGHSVDTTFHAYSEAPHGEPVDNELTNAGAGKTNYDAAFQAAFGIAAPITTSNVIYGYVDYTFYLKALSTEDNSKLALTNLNMLYDDDNNAETAPVALGANDLAWRVAVIKNSAAVSANTAYTGAVENVSLLSKGRVATDYQTSGMAVKSGDTTTASGALVNFNTAAVIDGDIDKGVTRYYYVTLRLWLEGEDKNCTNEKYLELTNKYSLDAEFSLGTAAAGVTAIGSVAA